MKIFCQVQGIAAVYSDKQLLLYPLVDEKRIVFAVHVRKHFVTMLIIDNH